MVGQKWKKQKKKKKTKKKKKKKMKEKKKETKQNEKKKKNEEEKEKKERKSKPTEKQTHTHTHTHTHNPTMTLASGRNSPLGDYHPPAIILFRSMLLVEGEERKTGRVIERLSRFRSIFFCGVFRCRRIPHPFVNRLLIELGFRVS